MTITPEQEKLSKHLIDGALSIFENADRLFFEAGILASVDAFPRAYLLHQISLEECGKIEILCAAITSCLSGIEVDKKSIAKAFRRHESKNKINAYFLPRSEEELAAEAADDLAATLEAFKNVQDEFHNESNRLKNSSLYVDFDDEFSSPQEVISRNDYERIRAQNEDFMALTNFKIEMLTKWKDDIAQAATKIGQLHELLAKTKTKGVAPSETSELLRQFINMTTIKVKE